jgi:hypothetical protein
MFEIGKDYKVTMIVGIPGGWSDEEGAQNPHVKDKIVNTASWHFVSAELI